MDFPSADPELVQTLQREIASARQRQERLVEAAPSHYRRYRDAEGGGRPQYTVSSGRGGVVPYGGVAEPDRGAPRFGNKAPDATQGSSSGGAGFGNPRAGNGASDTALGGPALVDPTQPGSNGSASNVAGKTQNSTRTETTSAGLAAKKSATSFERTPSAENTATAGEALRPGEWRPTDPRARAPREDSDADSPQQANSHSKSLAKTRGRNWGLPDASPRSTPLVQPIRIECYPDRLVVVAQEGRAGGKIIPLGPATEASIDAFVSAIWSHMETWGIAGSNMYWQPVLNVYVGVGAEQRFADLQALLKDSGLAVEKKGEQVSITKAESGANRELPSRGY